MSFIGDFIEVLACSPASAAALAPTAIMTAIENVFIHIPPYGRNVFGRPEYSAWFGHIDAGDDLHSASTLFEAHLPVSSLETSITFYRDRVGLEVAHVIEGRVAFLWIGGRGRAMLGLWLAGSAPQTLMLHLAFGLTIADVLGAAQALRARGIAPLDFDGRPTEEAVVLAWMPAVALYFRDPDGHLLEYIAMLPDPPRPEAGVMTWTAWRAAASANLSALDPSANAPQPLLGRQSNVAPLDATGVSAVTPFVRRARILAISGSLRRASSNTALIAAAVRCTPPDVDVIVYDDLATIPPFNQDLDTDTPPNPVRRLRAALDTCDALVISSPEYAHGVPGVLKNALDWVVGSGELIDKPVALINASARATHAWHALVEILTTMSARVIREASITIPVNGPNPDENALLDSGASHSLRAALDALAKACAGLTPKE